MKILDRNSNAKRRSPFFGALIPLLVLVLLMTPGCNRFLDIHPKGFLIPSRVEEYEYLIAHSQLVKVGDTYPEYLTDNVKLVDDENDYFAAIVNQSPSIQRLYSFAHGGVFDEIDEDYSWQLGYERINIYNTIINHVPECAGGGEPAGRSLVAEALVGRAAEYFALVNLYAPFYDPATADSDPGVPLRLTDDIDAGNLPRSSVKQVYDRMIEDLNAALKDLPDKPKVNATRAGSAAAHGYLARIYLCTGDYEKALQHANAVLDKHPVLVNLNDYEVTDPMRTIGRNNVPQQDKNPENLYIRYNPYTFGLSMTVYLSDDLVALFDTQNDQRFVLYATNTPFGMPLDNYLCMRWSYDNAGITTPEMYLIAAECEARLGNTAAALERVNDLRRHRFAINADLSTSDPEEALKMILDERRRELAMMGMARFIDLKRLNKEPRFAKTVRHTVNGVEIELPPNDPRYIMPIPKNVMDKNPNLTPFDR